MEGGADTGASTTDSAVNGGGSPTTPPTNTQSGIAIGQVYAGAGFFTGAMKSRKQHFHESHQQYRRPDYGTDDRNPHVGPSYGPKGGIDMKRNMSGLGVGYQDALDLFKPMSSNLNKVSTGVRMNHRPQDPMRRRQSGISSYLKANPQNKDGA
jgi:hypothetical protein